MPFEYYTESRLVPLYKEAPGGIGDAGESVNLLPQTKVVGESERDSVTVAAPYLKVAIPANCTQVQAPAWTERGGWVLSRFLRKGKKIGTSSAITGEEFTGVTYGDYRNKSSGGADSARFVKKVEMVKQEKAAPRKIPGFLCAKCGRLSADHRVYETKSLRKLSQELVKTWKGELPVMFGVLEVREKDGTKRQLVLAESGTKVTKMASISLDFVLTTAKSLGIPAERAYYATVESFKDKKLVSCDGKDLTLGNNKFDCAAPKLVQYFAVYLHEQYKEPVLYMSEVCGTPEKADSIYMAAHTAESCDTCRNQVPQMLCGLTNLEREKVDGRYVKRA